MKAAFCIDAAKSPLEFEIRDGVAKPSLEGKPPGCVVVKVIAASICGTDLWGAGGCCGHQWRNRTDYLKLNQVCGGTGHEIVGEVVGMVEPLPGKEKNQLSVGQKVLAMSPIYILNIKPLRDKIKNEIKKDPSEFLPVEGGFTEFMLSFSSLCVPLPETLPPRPMLDKFNPLWYVAAQPLGTILFSLTKIGNIIGKDVAIVGAGQNGLIMTQLVAGLGAHSVIVLDLLDNRLKVAKQMKATHTLRVSLEDHDYVDKMKEKVMEITDGNLCDLVVDMVGHQSKTIDFCGELSKDHGTVLLFGIPPASDQEQMSIRRSNFQKSLHFICSSSPPYEMFELAVEMISQERFDPSPLYTHVMPFEKFHDAYEMASQYKDNVVKVLLTSLTSKDLD
jgi:threonine dehydrogenase-like Zn-dependent dehydrogenase